MHFYGISVLTELEHLLRGKKMQSDRGQRSNDWAASAAVRAALVSGGAPLAQAERTERPESPCFVTRVS